MGVDLEKLKSLMHKSSSVKKKEESVPAFELDDDGEEYMSVGTDGVLAASEKLLAINRGLADTDERDSLKFQKILRPHAMLRESIKMDAGKVARQMMYLAARRKNLSGVGTAAFDPYVERLLVGNPLTSPLEEINPMQLTESARRITKMGPGGLASSESITAEAQAVHPSQFGFIDPISGPECCVDNDEFETRIFTSEGWVRIKDITKQTKIACEVDSNIVFTEPERVIHEDYSGDVYIGEGTSISFAVTPNHRFYYLQPAYKQRVSRKEMPAKLRVDTIENIAKKRSQHPVPCKFGKYEGTYKNAVEIGDKTFAAADWCALLGWFLSEGSVCGDEVRIHQSQDVHPSEYAEILELVRRMGISYAEMRTTPYMHKTRGYTQHIGIRITEKTVCRYLISNWNNGCYDKWIPEEIFHWGYDERAALLDALLKGDGRVNKSHTTYCSVCKKLAEDVERLMITLGYCTRIRKEKDKRPHVKTTNYCACALSKEYHHIKPDGKNSSFRLTKRQFSGKVHCATVPNGKIYISVNGCPGFWTGNSERAGVDVRTAWGTMLGSNGRLYQKFYDRRAKKMRWMSPEDLDGLTIKIPD